MADDGDFNNYRDDVPELDSPLNSPSSPPPLTEDGGGEASVAAAVVVESVFDEVVTFIAEKLGSLSMNNNDSYGDEFEDFFGRMEELNQNVNGIDEEPEPPALTAAVEEFNETTVKIALDATFELGQNGLSSKDISEVPGSSGSSVYEDQSGNCGGNEVSSNDSCSKGTETVEYEEASNALMLMQALIGENKSLQEQAAKMKRTMSFVMSKYRKTVTFLLNELNMYKTDVQKMVKMLEEKGQNYDPKMEVYNRNVTIEEMKQVMFAAARVDDSTSNLYEEKISQLRYENQGLRKIIRVSLDYGGERLLSYEDKSVQTEVVPEEVTVNEELATMVAKRGESLDVYASTYEYEDDMESFHTADSLNGSSLSINREPDVTCGASPKSEVPQSSSPIPPIIPATNPAMIGDQDKVEFDTVLMEVVTSK